MKNYLLIEENEKYKQRMEFERRARVLKTTEIFLKDKSTVREVAKKVGCSKSTVHKDLTKRLPEINLHLFEQVKDLLEYNKSVRHIRGGEGTKRRHLKICNYADENV